MRYGIINRATGGTATASSTGDGSSPVNAFDGNDATDWHTPGNGAPQWLKYDFGAGVTWKICKVRLLLRAGDGCWKNFNIQGSNNDSTWTTLYTGVAANSEAEQIFTFSNSVKYRYILHTITSNQYDPYCYANTYTLQMFEGIPSGGLGIGNPWIFIKDMWEKHDRLWIPKLSEGYSY